MREYSTMQDQRTTKQRQSHIISSARERNARPGSGTWNQDGVVDTELSHRDYNSSNFPSLLTQLGTRKVRNNSASTQHKPRREVRRPSVDIHGRRIRRYDEHMSFGEEMRRRDEAQWMRIQAVAKDKLDKYDAYTKEMQIKVKRQREQINRRSQELLESLAREEEKKREEVFNESTHNRIWRHHRRMQRRVFSLEPMSSNDDISSTIMTS